MQGLSGHYLARQSGEVAGPPEGVAMFIRSSMFVTLATQVCGGIKSRKKIVETGAASEGSY